MDTRMCLSLFKGLLTFVPPLSRLTCARTGGSRSARYCYSVYLRHMVVAAHLGLPTDPAHVVELGPGDTLGVGLAAVLCGAARYTALDVKAYSDAEANAAILDELAGLLDRREPIPGDDELPGVYPKLDSYAFPATILTEPRLSAATDPERLSATRDALWGKTPDHAGVPVRIESRAPWLADGLVAPASVDLVISQAVFEHIDDYRPVHAATAQWLRPGGYVSHVIDFSSHGLSRRWNGHWNCSPRLWRAIRGRRPYLINRAPLSAQLAAMADAGLDVVHTDRLERSDGGTVGRQAGLGLTDQDIVTATAHVVARPAAIRTAAGSPGRN